MELQNSLHYKYEPPQGTHLSLDYEPCFILCHNTTLRGIKFIPSPYLVICTIIINRRMLSRAIKDQAADFPMEQVNLVQ